MRPVRGEPKEPEKPEDPGDSPDLIDGQMRLDFDG
jgi:hypothetical protein